MTPITQKHLYGCCAACVAFAVNKEYEEVIDLLAQEKANTKGFYCKDLVVALKNYGLSYRYKHVKYNIRNKIKKEGVIVFIAKSQKYPYGHFLIRHGGRWVDPWINLVLDPNISNARSGFRTRLPGKAKRIIYPFTIERF